MNMLLLNLFCFALGFSLALALLAVAAIWKLEDADEKAARRKLHEDLHARGLHRTRS